jgi:2OG-Fe(II) oxygenase superfamily/WD domain, G-beta repeat
MESNKQIQHLLSDNKFTCFIVPSLFSKEECGNLLTQKIKSAFEKAISNYPTYYRNNDRLQIDDELLANSLFAKIENYLPNVIDTNSTIKSENGKWQLSKLNERLRYCKYSTNQYFHRHLDGIHYRSADEQSKLTFMIYLNGANDFEGGRTLFYETKSAKEILASYIPQQGDLIIFDHNVWHEGEVLTKGEKFVLRSDILYKRIDTKSSDLLPFEGHLGYIWKILKFDANTIISGGRDKGIKIWNKDGELKQSLNGHNNSIIAIEKISSHCFVSASRDKTIKMWHRDNANEFSLNNTFYLHEAIVLSLCKLDENLFASSSGDNKIKIIHIDGFVENSLDEHGNWVWQIVSLKKGFLASCSEDCTIKIWDYAKLNSLFTFTEKFGLSAMLFIKEKNILICGNFNGEILIKKLANDFSEMNTRNIKAHNGIIRTLVQLNTRLIASGGEDNKVIIWDIETGESIDEYFHDNFVQSVALIGDDEILSASYDGTIKKIKINITN